MLEVIVKQDRRLIQVGIAAVTALAWWYTWELSRHCAMPMASSVTTPLCGAWTWRDGVAMFIMWAVMMVAMMLPSAAPMILIFAAVNRNRRQQARPFVPTAMFVVGYLAAWTGFSLLATLAQWGLHRAALLSSSMTLGHPWIGGFILIAAGMFQLTPLKRACLTRCRSPLGVLTAEWREGWRGAWAMGWRHGLFCVGCCWLLMVLLFVAGVMNVIWIAGLSLFVLVEKLQPADSSLGRWTGIGLVAWGVLLVSKR